MTAYPVEQATQAELDAMSPQQVLDARAEGRLDALLGVPPRPNSRRFAHPTAQLGADDLAGMTPAEIVAAKNAGLFDQLLGRPARYPHNLF